MTLSDHVLEGTWETTSRSDEDNLREHVDLTVVFHPEIERIGETLPLFDRGRTGHVRIGRNEPALRTPEGKLGLPLGSRHVSRQCFTLSHDAGGDVTLEHCGAEVFVEGARVTAPVRFDSAALARGVPISLGRHAVLWLAATSTRGATTSGHGLVGWSDEICRVRGEIEVVARLEVPVLLRGETGTGKELVAKALHAVGSRADKTFFSVNLAAIPATTAASELFGHRRGAFTGAQGERRGYFREVEGGTLFLDEIGDTPSEIQPMLLRAIEAGEIQPVGGAPEMVDVRVIAATDSNLEAAIQSGQFRSPLLRRFGYSIHVPALRHRRQDIGLLFRHFVEGELSLLGLKQADALGLRGGPLLPGGFAHAFMQHDWPGNVRELRNVVRRLLIRRSGSGGGPAALTLTEFGIVSRVPEPESAGPQSSDSKPAPSAEPTDEEVRAAWIANDYDQEATQKALGRKRTWLLAKLKDIGLRAKDLAQTRIEAALAASDGDVHRAAAALGVSPRALVLRMQALGMQRPNKS